MGITLHVDMSFDPHVVKLLFRCIDCQMIMSITLDDEEDEKDLKDAQNNKLYLQCACGSKCHILRD